MANNKQPSEPAHADSGLGQEVQKRNITISTDGVKFEIIENQLSLLELREVCRQILQRTGSP